MAEVNSRLSAAWSVNVDPRRETAAGVKEILTRATGELNWKDHDLWNFFLLKRFKLFSAIALDYDRNWEDPLIGRQIDRAFKDRAVGNLPPWSLPMVEYPDIVEWMRRQHWKNNKNKPPLATVPGEGDAVKPAVGSPTDGDSIDSSKEGKASGFWNHVL